MLKVNAEVLSHSVSAVAFIHYSYDSVLGPHLYSPFKDRRDGEKGKHSVLHLDSRSLGEIPSTVGRIIAALDFNTLCGMSQHIRNQTGRRF